MELDGQRLKEMRDAAFMGQEDLAKKVGVSHSQISRWESGKSTPRRYHLQKLTKIFPALVSRLDSPIPVGLAPGVNGLTCKMKIGVLALQGDFDAHRKRLEELGAEVVLVKKPEQLDEIDGLVIPGGESGTFLKLLGEAGFEKLKQFVGVKPTFGTCAGAILLANEVENPKQSGLGALDIRIRRNAYGRQIDSSIREGRLGKEPLEMIFIRAPKIERVGAGVEVIATESGDPVAVRQGRVMAATFHPELSDDTRVHQAFLDIVRK